ncbi:MAG: integration host factor subunit beta [Brevinematales bacterium]|jgi:integration host factor subunit beta|nr:integration host factor subunit beta [Brevinematales bacterium]
MGRSKLTKSDIVDIVFEDNDIREYGVSRREVSLVVSKFIEKLRESIEKLDDEDRIELRGFGTFGIKKRRARVARNPKTGQQVDVPERKSPYFKAGRDMKQSILHS